MAIVVCMTYFCGYVRLISIAIIREIVILSRLGNKRQCETDDHKNRCNVRQNDKSSRLFQEILAMKRSLRGKLDDRRASVGPRAAAQMVRIVLRQRSQESYMHS